MADEPQLTEAEAFMEKKVKILTSLAEENKILSYEKLQKELEFDSDEELEKFLIDAIHSKAVSGKLNAVSREFYITYYIQRNFDRGEWQQLRTRLQALIDNLKNRKKTIELACDPDPDVVIDEEICEEIILN